MLFTDEVEKRQYLRSVLYCNETQQVHLDFEESLFETDAGCVDVIKKCRSQQEATQLYNSFYLGKAYLFEAA